MKLILVITICKKRTRLNLNHIITGSMTPFKFLFNKSRHCGKMQTYLSVFLAHDSHKPKMSVPSVNYRLKQFP